ncbi:MAG: carboxypeptidase-like regulatory domain-containing protein [Dehalococcoidia bacterium]
MRTEVMRSHDPGEVVPRPTAVAAYPPESGGERLVVVTEWDNGDLAPDVPLSLISLSSPLTVFRQRTNEVGIAIFDRLSDTEYRVSSFLGIDREIRFKQSNERRIRLVLPRGVTVSGFVVDKNGNGIADAAIYSADAYRAMEHLVVTKSSGAFEVCVPSGTEICGRAAGYSESGRYQIVGAPGDFVELEIALREGGVAVHGRVVSPTGIGVKDAKVVIASASYEEFDPGGSRVRGAGPFSTRTDAEGCFDVVGLARVPATVTVAHPEYCVWSRVVDLARMDGEMTIRLAIGATVEGRVCDEHGVALSGVFVGCGRYGAISGKSCFTDQVGEYRIAGLGTGSVEIRAAKRGYMTVAQTVLLHGNEASHLDFRLDSGLWILGVVELASGESVNGLEVETRLASDPASNYGFAKLSQGGEFEISTDSRGEHKLRVFRPGSAMAARILLEETTVIPAPTPHHIVISDPVPTSVVTCRLAPAEEAMPDATLVLTSLAKPLGMWRGTPDFRGDIHIEDIPPGAFHAEVLIAGVTGAIDLGEHMVTPGRDLNLGLVRMEKPSVLVVTVENCGDCSGSDLVNLLVRQEGGKSGRPGGDGTAVPLSRFPVTMLVVPGTYSVSCSVRSLSCSGEVDAWSALTHRWTCVLEQRQ